MKTRALLACIILVLSSPTLAGKKKPKRKKTAGAQQSAVEKDSSAAKAAGSESAAAEDRRIIRDCKLDTVPTAWHMPFCIDKADGSSVNMCLVASTSVIGQKFEEALVLMSFFSTLDGAGDVRFISFREINPKQRIYFFLIYSRLISKLLSAEDDERCDRIYAKLDRAKRINTKAAGGLGTSNIASAKRAALDPAEKAWLLSLKTPPGLFYEMIEVDVDPKSGALTPEYAEYLKYLLEKLKRQHLSANLIARFRANRAGRSSAAVAATLFQEAQEEEEARRKEAEAKAAREAQFLDSDVPLPPKESDAEAEDACEGSAAAFAPPPASVQDGFDHLRATQTDLRFDRRVLRWRVFDNTLDALRCFRDNAERFPEYAAQNEIEARKSAAFHRPFFLVNLLVSELKTQGISHGKKTFFYLDPQTIIVEDDRIKYFFNGEVHFGKDPGTTIHSGRFELVFDVNPLREGSGIFHLWFVSDTEESGLTHAEQSVLSEGELDKEAAFQSVGRYLEFVLQEETGNLVILDHSFPGGLSYYVHPYIIQELRAGEIVPTEPVAQPTNDHDNPPEGAHIHLDPAQIPAPELEIPGLAAPGLTTAQRDRATGADGSC